MAGEELQFGQRNLVCDYTQWLPCPPLVYLLLLLYAFAGGLFDSPCLVWHRDVNVGGGKATYPFAEQSISSAIGVRMPIR